MGIGTVVVALAGLVVAIAFIVLVTKKPKHRKTYQEKIDGVISRRMPSGGPRTHEENLKLYRELIKSGAYSSAELACRGVADGQQFYECLKAVYP